MDSTATESFSTSIKGNQRMDNDSPLYSIILLTIGSLGFSMNLFVLIVMLATRKLRKKISVTFLLHQCSADLFSMLNVVVFYVAEYVRNGLSGISGIIYCHAVWSEFLVYSGLYAGVCNMVALSGERYIAIAHPMVYKSSASRKKFLVIILFCWIIAITLNVPYITMSRLADMECLLSYFMGSFVAQNIYVAVSSVITYFVPVAIIMIFYIRMIKVLRNRNKFARRDTNGLAKAESNMSMVEMVHKAQIRLVWTAIALGITFVLTWTPYNLYTFAYSAGADLTFQDNGYYFASAFAISSTAINPFIYVFSLKEFREGVKQLCFVRNNNNTQNSSPNLWHSSVESAA